MVEKKNKKIKLNKLTRKELFVVLIISLILVIITFLTSFQGNTDLKDYTNVAKFFSGELSSKIRTSHSYFYGFVHSPYNMVFENFLIFKITSLIALFLIVYSSYIISGRKRGVLWLILLAPISWYMAPWASPIQLSTLLFLWAWYFLKEYDLSGKKWHLIYSALLAGFSSAFWDGAMFFVVLLGISFFYDKRVWESIAFILLFFVGMLPRMILDQVLFGFAFFGIIRHIFASLTLTFFGGFYNQGSLYGLSNLILVILFIPFFTYLIFKKNVFSENKKTVIFLMLAVFLLILNSQIRFTLLILPISILTFEKYLSKKQYTAQICIFLIMSLLVLNPYVLQIGKQIPLENNGITGAEFGYVILNFRDIEILDYSNWDVIFADLKKIEENFPDEMFVVGNTDDAYSDLSMIYWGDGIREFVSIQDYNIFLTGEPIIFEKSYCSNTRIKSRRDICGKIWIRNAFNDYTDYENIRYGISFENELDLEGFKLVKEYKLLRVFEKD